MKIVNRQQFLALPANTVFARYAPCYMEALEIKGDSMPNDFFVQQIADAVDSHDSGEFAALLEAALETGSSVPMDFNCQYRDGGFNEGQLFAVFEKQDVQALIARLQECA
jgi:hypothetical protein